MKAELAVTILDRISLALGIAAIGIGLWLAGAWSGYVYGGSLLCEYEFPVRQTDPQLISFAGVINRPYGYLAELLIYFALSLFVFSLTKLFQSGLLIRFLCFIPLIYVVLLGLDGYKALSVDIKDESEYIDPLRQTVRLLHMAVALTASIIGLHVTTIIMTILSRRKQKLA